MSLSSILFLIYCQTHHLLIKNSWCWRTPKQVRSNKIKGLGHAKPHQIAKNTFLVAQLEKNLPKMQEARVWFLGWEDPLEKEMAIHSSILAWRTPWTEEPGRLPSMGSQVGHNSATKPPPPRLAFIDQMPKSAQNSSVFLINLPKHCFMCVFQFSSVTQLVSDSLWPHGRQHIRLPCPSPTPRACSNSCPLIQTHVHRCGDAIQPSHPLLSPSPPPSIFPSMRVFSNESVLRIRWLKYWSFCISPSNEYSGLISFRMDLLDLLAVQGTLKSILQHHSSKTSIIQHSAFFTVQLSHDHTWPQEKP